jgi:hypothetical protein
MRHDCHASLKISRIIAVHRIDRTIVVAYEIWETESGNVLGEYNTEAAALEAVRDVVAAHGEAAIETWLLMREDRRGRSRRVESGVALARRARALSPA